MGFASRGSVAFRELLIASLLLITYFACAVLPFWSATTPVLMWVWLRIWETCIDFCASFSWPWCSLPHLSDPPSAAHGSRSSPLGRQCECLDICVCKPIVYSRAVQPRSDLWRPWLTRLCSMFWMARRWFGFALEAVQLTWVNWYVTDSGSPLQQIVVNVVVLYWAMQGAGPPSSAGRGQSIHFSPLPHANSVRPGAIQNEDMLGVGNADKNSVFLTTLPTHGQRRDDFSLGIVSSVSIPTATVTFQKPEPVFQSPHYSRSGPQSSPSQPSLASTIEQSIKVSGSSISTKSA